MTLSKREQMVMVLSWLSKRQLIVVAYGGGVDSTAMLIGLWMAGIRPDAILFADTGGERPETYGHLYVMQAWLESVGFPCITIVRYVPKTAPYSTLEGNCLANETLPSLAFGGHGCSLKFKRDPQNKWLRAWKPAQEAWARGEKVIKLIGYDNGTRDCSRARHGDSNSTKPTKDAQIRWERKHIQFAYPLQSWGWDREACAEVILGAGMPLPMKSCCFFCPAMKVWEIEEQRERHPDLHARALAMETNWLNGKHEKGSTKGLGRKFAWAAAA